MAHDSLADRALAVVAHGCALIGIGYAAQAASAAKGWIRVPEVTSFPHAPSLSVIVPARNEERSIERCVRSLLAQSLPGIEVIVVDDRSEDATGAILAALKRQFPALRVVHGEPLPAGWVGKPWALAQGARVAQGTWLLFTDADTWHAPAACASTLAFAVSRGADALSLWTDQELVSWGERTVLPTILGMILIASGSMEQLNDPRNPEHALANGQYILVSRQAYDALGGHDALSDQLLDDVMFARRLKADGRFRLLLADGAEFVRVRMYRSLGEIWVGFTKNMYPGSGGDARVLTGAALYLAALSVIPAVVTVDAVVRRRPVRVLEGLLTLGSGIAVAAHGFRSARIPRRLAWFAPFGYAVCGAIMLNSTLQVLSGRGVSWRGRRYSGHPDGERRRGKKKRRPRVSLSFVSR